MDGEREEDPVSGWSPLLAERRMAGTMTIPRGMYGPNMDGLGDPEKASIGERHKTAVPRLQEERARRRAFSPLIRGLQAATDRALRRR